MDNSNNYKLKALIIDDEISGRTMIDYYLREYASDMFQDMISVATLREAISTMKSFKPDVIFTDYELRNENGLMIQSHLTKDIPVVVVSAHSQYALEAVQTNVFDIIFIEAAGAYSKIVTEAKNVIASKTLKSIESKLPSSFIRIHRSFIVPLNQIASYSSSIVCLKNGQQIALSKTGKKLLQSFI